ncbi:unnamed protein product [Symbiodinium pilosum]|uniref:Uncharacterized protein n=1 Tax=Symbiodinium pilosum TaxID=2952 RepID=A0A812TT82_SYMPI|nr:unnamed protein product [Symbiodinium pilosum]
MGDGAKWRGEGRRHRRERWSARHRQEPGVPEPDEPEPELPPEPPAEPPAEPPVPAEKVDISRIRRDLEEMRRTAQEGREKLLALEMPQGHMSGSQTWLPKMQQKKCPRKHRQIGGSCSSHAPAIEVKAASSGLAMHHFPLLSIFQSQAATEEELTAVYDELAEHWGQCEWWIERLQGMDLTMLTCLSTPKHFVPMEIVDDRVVNLKIPPSVLQESLSSYAEYTWLKAQRKMDKHKDKQAGIKNCYFAFRILCFGCQLLQHGLIPDLSAAQSLKRLAKHPRHRRHRLRSAASTEWL